MKKNKGTRIGHILGQVFDVRSWLDVDRMRSFTNYLTNGFRRLFIPQQNTEEQEESFTQAKERLNISDKELKSKQSALFRLSMLMCVIALFLLGYAVYHVIYGSYRAVIISLVVMFIALALAFRYHFWYFQIKQGKLGCTIQEWYRKGLLGEK